MAKGVLRKAVELIGIFGQDKRDHELEEWRKHQAQEQFKMAVEKQKLEFEKALKKRRIPEPLTVDELAERVLNGWGKAQQADSEEYVTTHQKADHRYKVPKEAPKASDEDVEATIERNEIYQRTQRAILSAQHKQVAYGLDKYPEPLNADTWSHIETIDHIIDESIDKLHYLMMLRIKLERDADESIENMRTAYETAGYSVETTQDPERVIMRSPEWFGGADMDGDTCVAMPSLASVNVPLDFDTTGLQKAIKDFNKKMAEGQVTKP